MTFKIVLVTYCRRIFYYISRKSLNIPTAINNLNAMSDFIPQRYGFIAKAISELVAQEGRRKCSQLF